MFQHVCFSGTDKVFERVPALLVCFSGTDKEDSDWLDVTDVDTYFAHVSIRAETIFRAGEN